MRDKKTTDQHYTVPKKRGNGQVRREVWTDPEGAVTRYNLAYINHQLFQGDNGRVLGYDNAHGVHHRHFKGKIEPIDYTTFKETDDRFEREWPRLVADI